MTTSARRPSARAAAASLTVLAVLLGAHVSPAGAAPAKPTQTMVVIGDSITASYNDKKGDPSRGWWSRLGSKLHLKPVLFAERASGYGRAGKPGTGKICQLTTFGDRLKRKDVIRAVEKARVVVLAGGVNDTKQCVKRDDGTWKYAKADPAVVRTRIKETIRQLDRIRRHDSSVYVTVPWGITPDLLPDRDWIVAAVRDEVAKEGNFRFVDTSRGILTRSRTKPAGLHPNEKGNLALYREIYYRSDIERWAGRR